MNPITVSEDFFSYSLASNLLLVSLRLKKVKTKRGLKFNYIFVFLNITFLEFNVK